MALSQAFVIAKVEAWPVALPLSESFVVSGGQMDVARNVYIRISLQNGTEGFGEMAPFPDISGETQETCLEGFPVAAQILLGQSALNWRRLAAGLGEVTGSLPSLRCGLEMALLDAVSRGMGIPLWGLWGGAEVRPRETDVTLPIGAIDLVLETARQWAARGFTLFKMKVGQDPEADIQRVEAVFRAHPSASFILDANQGFSVQQALDVLMAMNRLGIPVVLVEQPVHRDDVEGLREVHRQSPFPIAADESLRSLADGHGLIRQQAVDVFNVKIMKCGVVQSLDLIHLAKAAGLGLMIGGMVESRVAMGCSYSLVLGMGGFTFVDLDMPLLLAVDPVDGGFRYEGNVMHPWMTPGLGVAVTVDNSQVLVAQ